MAQTTGFASFVPILVVVSRACPGPLCPLLPCPLLHHLFGPLEVVVDAFGTACFVVTTHSNLLFQEADRT